MIIRRKLNSIGLCAALAAVTFLPCTTRASSHMDAPLITKDDTANTTDVYAFVSQRGGAKYLTVALAVSPFEEPGIGPNRYVFDPEVLYEIHLATGDRVAKGEASISYQFRFDTTVKVPNTIAQVYLGTINDVNDASQNLVQRYSVTKVFAKDFEKGKKSKDKKGPEFADKDRGEGSAFVLGKNLIVPPNNQGLATPFYNQGDSGQNPAKGGVSLATALDKYTASTIYDIGPGYRVFAGQRDDAFYADIQSIFDLDFSFSGPAKPFDSQGGFNVHTIVLEIPLAELGGDQQVVGVYATTSRSDKIEYRDPKDADKKPLVKTSGKFVSIGRQGNPLFCEALVANVDKDLYNSVAPTGDEVFRKYALTPELAALIGAPASLQTNRTDLAGIFIPDLIKVDLSTGPARLAGPPNDPGFHRLGIFGGDVLTSTIQAGFGGGTIPGGWPNGRRFGDDVIDIAVLAILSDLRGPVVIFDPDGAGPLTSADVNIDGVPANDISYNKVFPYAATPLNGRNHSHH